MIKRFQIEDLIAQDTSGVVFRAFDNETGKTVAVRRFFPFGSDGGGLQPEEQTAYQIAVQRLSNLSHPALRSIVCGGCDPVDGMPFIATEWFDGPTLRSYIEQGPLSAEVACALITQALEVCEMLSLVLAEEAVWVEIDPQSIIIGDAASDRPFTFWISPFKWLGGTQESRELESIVALTEHVMWWHGRIVGDQAGRGLGGWLKWLRANTNTISLKEARESLAASIGKEPPPPAEQLVLTASRPSLKKPSSSKSPLWVALALSLMVCAGAIGWFLTHDASPPLPVTGKPKAPPPTAAQQASDRAAEMLAQAEAADREAAEVLARQQEVVALQGGVYSALHSELLLKHETEEVVIEGILRDLNHSGNTKQGKSLYLVFCGEKGWDAARGKIEKSKAPADLTEDALKRLIGKKIRVRGKIKAQKCRNRVRPLIVFNTRTSIEVVE